MSSREVKSLNRVDRLKKRNLQSKIKKILIIFSIMVFIIILVLIFFGLKKDFIILNFDYDKNAIYEIIDYGSVYKEKKIKVKYGSLLLGYEDKVTIEKVSKDINIDTNKIKEYTIKYRIRVKNKVKNIKKIISVQDISSPVIIVEQDDDNIAYVCPNSDVYNIKYKAIDNLDGDVTNKVKEKIDDEYLTLSVNDKAGNKVTKKLKIVKKDVESPVITLNGSENILTSLNKLYSDEGVKVVDNCDGDISSSVEIVNNVVTSKVGNYEVEYKVKDTSGNESSKKRNVKVYDNSVVVKDKVIYLTFDDGPFKYTEKLLDVLKKHNIKATFFVTNQYPEYIHLLKREKEEGHTVAIHTFTHRYNQVYSSIDNYFEDLNKMNQVIYEQTGSYSKLVRLPGGSSNTLSRKYKVGIMTDITNELAKKGYHYFDWNCTSGDAGGTTDTNVVIANVTSCMKSGKTLVVLQHDIKAFSVDAVESIIKKGQELGYTFKALDENSYEAHQKLTN